MTHWIAVGQGGVIDTARVVAIANVRSAPVKRWLENTDPVRIINLTYGHPRQSVILLDNEYLILVPLSPDELARLMNGENPDECE